MDGLVGPAAAEALDLRRRAAEALLRDALRLDVARFANSETEFRLQARTAFRERFPPQAIATLRNDLDRMPHELALAAYDRLEDLRVWFGANPAEETEEATALARALEPVTAALAELLRTYAFPGDERAEEEGERGTVDLDADYRIEYRPSVNVVWAWRHLRAIDTARNELTDAGGLPARPSFSLVFHLPEVLPPDTSELPPVDLSD